MAKFGNYDWDAFKKKMQEEQSQRGKGRKKDERFWSPDWQPTNGGLFIIRFLPDPEGNPFIKYYKHSFKYQKDGAAKWYINNCATTFGYDPGCPVCDKVREYYDSPYDSDKKLAKERQRKGMFVSNILVIKDPAHPENNGKVFLFEYKFQVYKKLEQRLFPSDEDLQDPDFKAFVPFDPFEGADFKLKVEKQGEYASYSNSSFSNPSALFNGDEKKMKAVISQCHDLTEFLKPDLFPSRDKVLQAVGFLLGDVSGGSDSGDDAPATTPEPAAARPKESTVVRPKAVTRQTDDDDGAGPDNLPAEPAAASPGASSDDGGDDDDEQWFKKMR